MPSGGGPRRALARVRHAASIIAGSHGSRNAIATGTKYHHGPGRRCSGRRYRMRCSRTKKKSAKPGFRTSAITNHGTAMTANVASPAAGCSRRRIVVSRVSATYAITARMGSATPTTPLVSTASAQNAHAAIMRFLRVAATVRASCATRNAHSAPVMRADSDMSSVTNCDARK